MKNPGIVSWMAVATLLAAAPAFAQNQAQQGQGQAVVTILPKHEGAAPLSVPLQSLSVKVNGKDATVTKWAPFQSPDDTVELVLLIDGSARESLGIQMNDITNFIQKLPPNVKAAIAYMQYGGSVFAGPLTTDRAEILKNLHLPADFAFSSASPYFCLSDLAKKWPSRDPHARREVVMVTDGVDYYEMRYDPEDPYVLAAVEDAVRARLVVYTIYWINKGRVDATGYENFAGQNLLLELTQATGGKGFWEGWGNPVTFKPYFDEFLRRLQNQYNLRFDVRLDGKPQTETLKLKLKVPGAEVQIPEQVYVVPADSAKN